MDSGWIRLYRRIQDHEMWSEKPFTRGQAWIDLLMLANHKKTSFWKRGIKVIVERGQIGRSIKELADRWGWSRSKVDRFLSFLESERQIEHQKNQVTTIITLINYEIYQPKRTPKRTSNEHQTNTYNELKNVNNKELSCSEFLATKILERDPRYRFLQKGKKEQTLISWSKDFEKLHRIDKREWDEINEILVWCQEDDFWKNNILSGSKFREKYSKLKLKHDGEKSKKETTLGRQVQGVEETQRMMDAELTK